MCSGAMLYSVERLDDNDDVQQYDAIRGAELGLSFFLPSKFQTVAHRKFLAISKFPKNCVPLGDVYGLEL